MYPCKCEPRVDKEMESDSQIRTGIIQLSVVMLGRAPGSRALRDYIRTVEGGVTLEELAEQIAATPLFNNIFSETLSNLEFATAFLDKAFGDEVDPEIHLFAVQLVTAFLDQGETRASVAFLVAESLDKIGPGHPAYEDFSNAIARFDNQVAVAEHWSLSGYDWRPSHAVIANVTSDVSTRDAAIFEINNPPPQPPPGETFELTASVDFLTGTAGDDTFIAEDALTVMDRIDAGDGTDILEVLVSEGSLEFPTTASILNLEWLRVRVDGAIKGDLSGWEGLEIVDLREVGNEEYDQGILAIDLKASGTRVRGYEIDGDVFIANALSVDVEDVSPASDVNIASLENTEVVSVEGGRNIVIGAGFEEEEGARIVTGQSETVKWVYISNTTANRFRDDIDSVTIMSNAITYIGLSGTRAETNVINNSGQPEDLTIRLFEYGRLHAPAEVTLAGTGAAEIVDIVLEPRARLDPFPSGPFLLYGASNFTLQDHAIKTVNVSGPVLVPDGDAFTWQGRPVSGGFTTLHLAVANKNGAASSTLEHITVKDAGALVLDATDYVRLKSIDASASSGDNIFTVAGGIVESVITGSGNDTLTFAGTGNSAGFHANFGTGEDTLLLRSVIPTSSFDGGEGFDTVKLRNREALGQLAESGGETFSNFESLDISNIPGEFDLETLGFRHFTILSDLSDPVVIKNAVADDVSFHLVRSEVSDLMIEGSTDGRIYLNLNAGDEELYTRGSAVFEFSAPVTREIFVTTGGFDFPAYNRIGNLEADSLETLTISGTGRLEISSRLDSVMLVNAAGHSGRVDITAGGDGNPVTFLGGSGYDTFGGGAGNDTMSGGAEVDYLDGGAGDDSMTGGLEPDHLTGGPGSDTFRYAAVEEARLSYRLGLPLNVDTISDFEIGADIISLSESLGISSADLTGSFTHLMKTPLAHESRAWDFRNNLWDYVSDTEDFFSGSGGDYLMATVQHGEDLIVFLDLDGNGDFDDLTDMVIILAGMSQQEFTTEIFEIG